MLFDDPASLNPEEVLRWLEVCSLSLMHEEQQTYELLRTRADLSDSSWLLEAAGVGASKTEVQRYFEACQQELDLAAVLTLTAAAEARIRLDAERRGQTNAGELAQRLRVLRAGVQSAWQVPFYDGGILEAWKRYIGSLAHISAIERARLLSAIGRLNRLLNVRHWVAHGRYWALQWRMGPRQATAAAEIVEELYEALRRAADHGDLMEFA